MEVDHFLCKDNHIHAVVLWGNLIPACKRCNVSKGSHDVSVNPIVDPYSGDPKHHLAFRLYRLQPKTNVGRETIDVLNLNDPDRVVKIRFEIGEGIQQALANADERLREYHDDRSARRRNRIVSQASRILEECCPPASYAATSATVLHGDPMYSQLRQGMIDLDLWTEDLEDRHRSSGAIALDAT